MDSTLTDAAMLLAIQTTGDARNKHDGEIYIAHLARVWINVRNAGGDDVQQAIAWLHDSAEDGYIGYDTLRDLYAGFPECDRIIEGVRGMTKIKGESNVEYYHRCKANPDSRFVKLRGDLVDNYRRNHKITDPETAKRMAAKYSLGMDILT